MRKMGKRHIKDCLKGGIFKLLYLLNPYINPTLKTFFARARVIAKFDFIFQF